MSGPLRIALVGRAGSPNVQRWCEGLVQAGASIDLLSFERWDTDVVRVHPLRGGGLPGRLGYVAAAPQVAAWCRRHRPDVLIGYFVTGYGTTASLSGWRPVVQVAAGSDVLGPDPGTLKRLLRRRNLARADLVLVMAPHMEEATVRAGARPERILALPHGIPVDEFSPPADPPGEVSVVSTRSLDPFYRHDVIVRALAVLPSGPTATFVGSGPAVASIRRLAADLGVGDRIDFPGVIANRDLPGVLRRHVVYVSSAPTDGVSASLLEAMATGLLPVVVDNAANRFWIDHGTNGLLFAQGAHDELAAQLRRATEDVDLRTSAAAANVALVRERADRSANARQFLEALGRLVSERRAGVARRRPAAPPP